MAVNDRRWLPEMCSGDQMIGEYIESVCLGLSCDGFELFFLE